MPPCFRGSSHFYMRVWLESHSLLLSPTTTSSSSRRAALAPVHPLHADDAQKPLGDTTTGMMDTPRTEAFFFHPHRPSAPIDIPQSSKSVACPSGTSSSTRPLSPELIFEMEPFSPPTTNYNNDTLSQGASTSGPAPHFNDPERHTRPLLYPLPVLDLSELQSRRCESPRPTSAALPVASLPLYPIAHHGTRRRANTLVSQLHTDSDDSRSQSRDPEPYVRGRLIRPIPIHKVVGFTPVGSASSPSPAPERGRSTTIKSAAYLQTPSPTPPREKQKARERERQRESPVSAPATLTLTPRRAPSRSRSRQTCSPRPPPRHRTSSSSHTGSAPAAAWRISTYAAHGYGYHADSDEVDFAQFLRRRIENRHALTPSSLHSTTAIFRQACVAR
ncbi:hypothetical protein HMN09_01055700 [Mycena chlorophos]|uniref:Uncharacterized protein n=1 Tax=Mycena chlorophos TaxID=658473 RepID=A0A8H6SD25_MYCCL|nr:hypothetical protein HMN09_01055700 [Mycena chlorophos]